MSISKCTIEDLFDIICTIPFDANSFKNILKSGVDVNQLSQVERVVEDIHHDEYIESNILLYACIQGNIEAMRLLLIYGAKPYINCDNNQPIYQFLNEYLWIFQYEDQYVWIELILFILNMHPKFGNEEFMINISSISKCNSIVVALLNNGKCLNYRNKYLGETLLIASATTPLNLHLIKFILTFKKCPCNNNCGYSYENYINIYNNAGNSALMITTDNSDLDDISNVLIEAGAKKYIDQKYRNKKARYI